MGDRAQINVRGTGTQGIFLYDHWNGTDLPSTVRAALARGRDRWDSPEYLARILFADLTRSDPDGTTGCGIAAEPFDVWRTIEIVPTQDPEHPAGRIRILDSGPDGGLSYLSPPRTVINEDLGAYADRDAIRLVRCPCCGAWSDLDEHGHTDEAGETVGYRCSQCGRDLLWLDGNRDRIFTRGPDGIACEVDRRTGELIDPETTAIQASTTAPRGV